MALPISTPDLSLLRPGVRVRLGGDKDLKNKPYPTGWQTVAETDVVRDAAVNSPHKVLSFRVDSDARWLPPHLIEEIALP